MLVGIVPTRADLERLLEERWYRIPMESVPRSRAWPPAWFAAFEPKPVSGSVQLVRYYARVEQIDENVSRRDLLPGTPAGAKRDRRYAVLRLGTVFERSVPIVARRPRRNPFIPTTRGRFALAETINDLFDVSPLEDRLWQGFRQIGIEASVERQWELQAPKRRYYLDFAVFCEDGNIDVEADGDSYHLAPEAVKRDKARSRDLEEMGWRVLRYSPEEVQRDLDGCLTQIANTISTCGGLEDSGLAPRVVPQTPNEAQGRLF